MVTHETVLKSPRKRKCKARTHGASNHPLYDCWRAMIKRCSVDHPQYKSWYGRGIKVCAEWRQDPWAFIRWAEVNGWKKGLEIDRIDNDGDYTPNNCRFVTDREQARNRRPANISPAGRMRITAAVTASNRRRKWSPEERLKIGERSRAMHERKRRERSIG